MSRKTRQSSAEKETDRRVASAYYRSCEGIEIPMLKIPAIYAVGRKAIAEGADDAALELAIRTYVDTIKAKKDA